MWYKFAALPVLSWVLLVVWPALLTQDQVLITDPVSGSAVQGIAIVSGTTALPGFRLAEVSFAYQADPTGTWFLLASLSSPVTAGELVRWDTSTISDGIYRLRVQVFLDNGQVVESQVDGLRVRNYTAVETSTPAALPAATQARTPTATRLPDYRLTPPVSTPLPTNPARITTADIRRSAWRGGMFVFGALVISGLYLGLRAAFRR